MATEEEQDLAAATHRARRVRLLLFDVDGVLTDGTIWVVPTGQPASREGDISALQNEGAHDRNWMEADATASGDGGFGLQSQNMAEMKGFSAHDGMGISIARIAGLKVGFITKRVSEALKVRARDLKIEFLYMGQAHKMKALLEILEKTGLRLEQVAYVGDDIVDLPVLRHVGLAIGVADARPQVLNEVHWVTPHGGGRGAGRDAIDFILEAQGVLAHTIERYLDEQNPVSAESDIGTGNM